MEEYGNVVVRGMRHSHKLLISAKWVKWDFRSKLDFSLQEFLEFEVCSNCCRADSGFD
jgi:hypothetical protein